MSPFIFFSINNFKVWCWGFDNFRNIFWVWLNHRFWLGNLFKVCFVIA
jgi:hypothetical protein